MPRLLKRLCLGLACLLLLGAVVLALGGNWALEKVTRVALPKVIADSGGRAGKLSEVTFERVKASPWSGHAEWHGVTALASLPPGTRRTGPKAVRIRMERLTARLTGLFPPRADV